MTGTHTISAVFAALGAVLLATAGGSALAEDSTGASCPAFLDHDLRKLHSADSVNLCELAAGKPLLVVNTASHCGFTGQFEGLQALHETYRDQGLVVVGFASDDFRQEAATEEEAASVCYKNFGVEFTMIAPGPVTGAGATPVFAHINDQSTPPQWNFSKYLLDGDGQVLEAYPSWVGPSDPELRKAIESVL